MSAKVDICCPPRLEDPLDSCYTSTYTYYIQYGYMCVYNMYDIQNMKGTYVHLRIHTHNALRKEDVGEYMLTYVY